MKFNPDIHHRRSIRLKDYDYSSNGLYYITICTQERVNLFGEIVGSTLCNCPNNIDEMIFKWLNEIGNKYAGVHIDKYVIMPNHVHFIAYIQDGYAGSPLSEIIGWFKTMTTNEYIRGVNTGLYISFNKRMWQRNYYERIIRDKDEYQHVWQYIDQNPARWTEDEFYTP